MSRDNMRRHVVSEIDHFDNTKLSGSKMFEVFIEHNFNTGLINPPQLDSPFLPEAIVVQLSSGLDVSLFGGGLVEYNHSNI